jgi:RHS repeat-associated protein
MPGTKSQRRRIQNASGTSFLYDGANAAQELSGNSVTANLLSGSVDEVFTRTDSGGAFAQLKDALGSTIALMDSSGTVQTSYTYDPYGGTSVTGTANGNEFQYTGRENEGNGLYYYRARYYSPLLGRFTSEDPLGFRGSGPNVYAYSHGSPTNLADPYGLESGDLDKLVPGPNGETSRKPLAGRKGQIWWSDFWHSFFHDFSFSEGPNGKRLCTAVFFDSVIDELNPFNTGLDDAIEEQTKNTLEAIEVLYYSRAVSYAGGRLLIKPLGSSVVRGLLASSEAAAEWGNVAAVGFADYKLAKAGLTTIDVRLEGRCYASFVPLDQQ